MVSKVFADYPSGWKLEREYCTLRVRITSALKLIVDHFEQNEPKPHI